MQSIKPSLNKLRPCALCKYHKFGQCFIRSTCVIQRHTCMIHRLLTMIPWENAIYQYIESQNHDLEVTSKTFLLLLELVDLVLWKHVQTRFKDDYERGDHLTTSKPPAALHNQTNAQSKYDNLQITQNLFRIRKERALQAGWWIRSMWTVSKI